MGKMNFRDLYRRIKAQQGTVTCEISTFSDNFNPLFRYAGIIVYAVDGKFEWENHEGGKADGCKGRSFYIIIQCTDTWPDDYYRPEGQGTVHEHLLKSVMGIEYYQKRVACGGFAFLFGDLRFSSISLNGTDQTNAESDGDRYMSGPEKLLVTYCWEEYKKFGANYVFAIPSFIDQQLSN